MNKGELLQRAKSALGTGDIQTAGKLCQQILGSDPHHSEAALLFASVCMHSGRNDTALGLLKNLLRREPTSAQVNAAMSGLLFRTGNASEARTHGLRAIKLRPDNPAVHASFALDLEAAGYAEESKEVLDQAIQEHANDSDFLRGLADCFIRAKRYPEAVRALEQVVAIAPDDYFGWLVLGRIRVGAGDFEGGIAAGRQAVRCNDNSPECHLMLAMTLHNRHFEDDAAVHYQRVTELKPTEAVALTSLGLIRQHQGRFVEANRLLNQAIALRASAGLAQYVMMRAAKLTRGDESRLAALQASVKDPNATPIDRVYLFHAIAKGWEDLGENEKAMEAYNAANALSYEFWLRGKPWDRKTDQDFFTKVIAAFTPEAIRDLRSRGFESRTPVLIVGMPRSGTSLVEQIISSHPEVSGAGELEFWHEHGPKIFVGSNKAVDEAALMTAGEKYLALLNSTGEGYARITDKMPQNFPFLGAVCSAFPNGRIIHVRRNALDTCLSIYATPFGRPAIFTHRLSDILFMYQEYTRIMEYWREVLDPSQFMEVDYEEIVSDPEPVARKMIDFLDLPWDDACLDHQGNQRLVRTASVWQVRQPIYSSSIDRWKKFKPWLGELLELEGLRG